MNRSRTGTPSARAFTLVEVLLASAVGFVILAVLYSLLSSSVRQFSATQRHLGIHSTAQTVLDIVQDGLTGMMVDPGESDTMLQPAEGLNSLSFYVSRSDELTGFYRGHKERYGKTPEPGGRYFYFTHNGRVHKDLTVKSLLFDVLRRPGLDGTSLYFVRTTVTAVNPTRSDTVKESTFTLVGLTALTNQTMALRGGHWNPNPYIYKRF